MNPQTDDDPVFAWAVQLVLVREGVCSPNGDGRSDDKFGGLTRFGWSQRKNPDVDVENLTYERAIELYRERKWRKLRCAEMPPPVALCVFDSAVNAGDLPTGRMLQQVARVAQDGIIGPRTLAAVNALDPFETVAYFQTLRVLRYVLTRGWETYRTGWVRRTFIVSIQAFSNPPGSSSSSSN